MSKKENAFVDQFPTDVVINTLKGEYAIINLIQSEIERIHAYEVPTNPYANELISARDIYVNAFEMVKEALKDRGIEVEEHFKIMGRPELSDKLEIVHVPEEEVPTEDETKEIPITETIEAPIETVVEDTTAGKSNKE